MEKKKVVFVLGPTAVGKSDVAIALAKHFSGQIISADSVQVFRGFDIGSAKIKESEMQNVVHYGIDIVDPNEHFSAFDFVQYASEKIDEICKKNLLPIVVGGTGLFVKGLTQGFNFGGQGSIESRAEVEKIMSQGLSFAFETLSHLDEEMAKSIDKSNPVRVSRALEIVFSGGKKETSETNINPLIFALNLPRDVLYKKIDKRAEKMVENGLVDEVRNLLESGVSKDCQGMRAIGYKEAVSFLDGEISHERMLELIKQHSRNYAKRQITFLKKMPCVWVDVSQKNSFEKILEEVKAFL